MAKCGACKQEMKKAVSCTQETYDDFEDKVERQRFRWEGYVGELSPLGPYATELMKKGHCSSCLTPTGGLHHPGCDVERCPNCQGQAISCGCADGSEEEDEE